MRPSGKTVKTDVSRTLMKRGKNWCLVCPPGNIVKLEAVVLAEKCPFKKLPQALMSRKTQVLGIANFGHFWEPYFFRNLAWSYKRGWSLSTGTCKEENDLWFQKRRFSATKRDKIWQNKFVNICVDNIYEQNWSLQFVALFRVKKTRLYGVATANQMINTGDPIQRQRSSSWAIS